MNNTLPQMRGIKQAITELKATDPNTAFTEKALRRLILAGEIPSIRIGKKYLVNMNILKSYLCGGFCTEPIHEVENGIRMVAE